MQLFMGIGIDLHGIRRTVLTAFPLAIAGAVLSAISTSYGVLVAGQVLIGVGCAPAFLVCTVFIARHFPAARFATMSGLVLAIGGVGMLVDRYAARVAGAGALVAHGLRRAGGRFRAGLAVDLALGARAGAARHAIEGIDGRGAASVRRAVRACRTRSESWCSAP